jgi:predicted RNA binding protein YcfA (HicA-like mRNA interferase family)
MPSEVRFADIRRFLEQHGYTFVRITSSHHIFSKPGAPQVSLPVHKGRVQPVYIHRIEKTLGVKYW